MRETAQLLTVRARPEPLSLDLSKTAIFVVDRPLVIGDVAAAQLVLSNPQRNVRSVREFQR